jgi:hypothetical protein
MIFKILEYFKNSLMNNMIYTIGKELSPIPWQFETLHVQSTNTQTCTLILYISIPNSLYTKLWGCQFSWILVQSSFNGFV